MFIKRHVSKLGLLSLVAFYSASSHAAIDLTAATAAITDGDTAIATLGLLVLSTVIGIRVWKRLRGVA